MDAIAQIGVAVVVFASTDIDDLFVLMGFFAHPRYRAAEVVLGQYLGIAALFGVCAIAALAALVIPKAFVGLLGLVPIFLGAKMALDLWLGQATTEDRLVVDAGVGARTRVLSVAAVTIANGGDNIGIYAPLFATRTGHELGIL